MTSSPFNIEDEFGDFLDILQNQLAAMHEGRLSHAGVKGMRWGVRKDKTPKPPMSSIGPDKIVRKTANGETLTLSKEPPTKMQNWLGSKSKSYRENYENTAHLTITDSSGKKVGDASVEKRSKDELYLNWLGIESSERGKGYATAVMHSAEEFGRQSGFKKMTLEVPGNSPDARHIYEKLGFTVVKEATKEDMASDPMWGGLTEMERRLDRITHDDISDFIAGVSENADTLEHHGVKGMKWGKRKADGSTQTLGERSQGIREARDRQRNRSSELNRLNKENKSSTTSSAQKSKNAAEMKRLAKELQDSPDRSAAKRLTTGEHAVNLVLMGFAAPITSGIVRGASNAEVKLAVRRAEKASVNN